MTGGDMAPPPTNPRSISFEEQMEELEREQREEEIEIEPDEAENEDEKLPQSRVGRDV
jgi:putative ABC transport system ATP-binding protein